MSGDRTSPPATDLEGLARFVLARAGNAVGCVVQYDADGSAGLSARDRSIVRFTSRRRRLR